MSEIDRIDQAIADEQSQVTAAVTDLQNQINDLKGQVLTPEVADQIIAKVQGIFTPTAAPATTPEATA